MASTYEGTFRIRNHADKGITLERGISTSTLTAADVNKALDIMIEAASNAKCGFDIWTLYIPGINEKIRDQGLKQVPLAKVKAALKEAGNVVEIHRGKYGIPKIVIGKETVVTKRVSKYVDIA